MSDTTERCEDCGHPLEDWCDCECCMFKAERWLEGVLDGIQ